MGEELQESCRGDVLKVFQVEGKIVLSETVAVLELFVGILLLGSHLVEVAKDVQQDHILKELSGS